jgi:hypothetical protein
LATARNATLRHTIILSRDNLHVRLTWWRPGVLNTVLHHLACHMLLSGNWDWHLHDLLHNLFHDLLHRYRDFNCPDHLVGHLYSLHVRHRYVIWNLNAPFNNPDDFLGARAINDFLHRVGHVDRARHWDMNWCWDWAWAVNNPLHNLLNRVGHITCDDLLNRVGDLHWDLLVLGNWNLDNFFDDLLNGIRDSFVDNALHWNWHPSLNNDFVGEWHLNNFGHSNLTRHLHNLLHNLLHWVGNIAILDLFDRHRNLDSADYFMRHRNVASCDDFMWHWNLDTFWDANLVWHIHTPFNHLLHRVRNLSLNHLLHRVWHLAVHDLFHWVWNLHMLWHVHRHIHGHLSDDLTWNLHGDLTHHLLCDRVWFMSYNLTDDRVRHGHLLNHTALHWNGNIHDLFTNLGNRHRDPFFYNLLNWVRYLTVLDALHRHWDLDSLRYRYLTWDRNTALDDALNRNWNCSLNNTFNWNDVLALNQFNLVLTLNLNVLHLRDIFPANDTLSSQLCSRRNGLPIGLLTSRVSSGSSISCGCSVSCRCCSKSAGDSR